MVSYRQVNMYVHFEGKLEVKLAGKRVDGDSLYSESFDTYDFDGTKDFNLEVTYPKQNEFYITHVSCLVEQSSSIGRAYTVDGGVGWNHMKLMFEAKRTGYFYYRVYVFGRKFQ